MDNVEAFLAGPVSYHQRHKKEHWMWTPHCEVCRHALDRILLIMGIV